MPKTCSTCFYGKKMAGEWSSPRWHCLHPVSVAADIVAGVMPALAGAMRDSEGPCGIEGALHRPTTMLAPEPLHLFRQ